jgi:hypothetical protein
MSKHRITTDFLPQDCQLPDKNSYDISRDIWSFFCGVSKFVFIYLFIPRLIATPLTMFSGTLVVKHLSKQSKMTLHAPKLVAASSSETSITINPSSHTGGF